MKVAEGRLWKTRLGRVNRSGAYQGPLFFIYQGIKLTDLSVTSDMN